MTFGQQLRKLREAAGLTQEALARAARLSLSAVAKMEAKPIDPSWSTVCRLARALGVSLADFELPDEPAPPPAPAPKPKRPAKR